VNPLPLNASQYRWCKLPSGRFYSLVAGGETFGSLDFAANSGSLATGITAHGVWTFKRQGFVSPRVTVCRGGTNVIMAVFHLSLTGGGDFLYANQQYHFIGSGWFHPRWSVTHNGTTILLAETSDRETWIQLHPEAKEPLAPDVLSLLLLLAIYVPVLAEEDATTAAVTAAMITVCS